MTHPLRAEPAQVIPGPFPGTDAERPTPEPALCPDRLWSIDDVATYLHVSRRGVERLRSAGRFPKPSITIGRCHRWFPATILAWVRDGGRP